MCLLGVRAWLGGFCLHFVTFSTVHVQILILACSGRARQPKRLRTAPIHPRGTQRAGRGSRADAVDKVKARQY